MDKNGTKDNIRGSDEFVIRENDDRDRTDCDTPPCSPRS